MKFTAGKVRFAGNGRNVTAHAGHVLYDVAMQGSGFLEAADAFLPAPRSGRGFHPRTYMSTMVHLLAAGGSCFSDLHNLNTDDLFRGRPLPAVSTLTEFVHRCGTAKGLAGLENLHRHALASVLGSKKRVGVLDIDDTHFPAKHRTAKKNWKGQQGYNAIVATLEGVDVIVAEELREGNTKPGSHAAELLDKCLANMPTNAGFSIVRGDSAYGGTETIGWCVDHGKDFVFAARRNVAVQALADRLPRKAWKPYQEGESRRKAWIAEGEHTMKRPGKPPLTFRVVFLCRPKRGKRLPKFPSTAMRAYATSLKDAPERIVALYRRRGEMENRIKEWKRDLSAARMPCGTLGANAAWARIAAISYNLHIGISRKLFPKLRLRLRSVRWKVLQIAGAIVRHARCWHVKVSNKHYRKLCKWRLAIEAGLIS